MNEFIFHSNSPEDTDRLGAALAAEIPDGTVVALCGTLGAGKTRLVQSLAVACGIQREDVVSPTFVICQEHVGLRKLYHFDVYRLQSDEEFRQLGPEEFFDADGIALVEWADKVANSLPEQRLEIRITVTGETTRDFHVLPLGGLLPELTETLCKRLA